MAVINFIKEYRKELGLSQEELALAVNVSRQTIYAIEAGKYNPSLELSLGLARFFGVTVEALFKLEDE